MEKENEELAKVLIDVFADYERSLRKLKAESDSALNEVSYRKYCELRDKYYTCCSIFFEELIGAVDVLREEITNG